MNKFIAIALVLVASLASISSADQSSPHQQAYRPSSSDSYSPHSRGGYEDVPSPYAYQYGVVDEHTGTSFDKTEQQDASGNLQGSYRVNLPDGRVQVVSYTATHEGGYVADVKYEGQASYPDSPSEGGYKSHYSPPKHNTYSSKPQSSQPQHHHSQPQHHHSQPHPGSSSSSFDTPLPFGPSGI